MRFLPVTALATIAALYAAPLCSAENEGLRGSRSEEASLLTLQGTVLVFSPEQQEATDSIGVFVTENGREMLLSLSNQALLPQIKKRDGKTMTLRGCLIEQGKTFLVQQLCLPGRGASQGRREM